MKTKLLFLPALFVLIGCGSAQQPSVPQAENYEPTTESIQTSMNLLASDSLQGRKTGEIGIEKAAEHIENTFENVGIQPYFETYRDHFKAKDSIDAFNVVGYIEGSDPALKNEFVLLGAHYDHLGHISAIAGDSIANGANDNASGTVAIMETAKHFASKNPKRSILFVLFSAEELGLLGSKHLAQKLKKENMDLYTMLNFEMVGVPLENKPYLAYLTGFEKSNMAEKFNEYTGEEVFGFLPEAKKYQLFFRSDNYPFFEEFGIPAQTLCTFDFTNYPYYHHVEDEAPLMDIEHMKSLIMAVIPGIETMTNTTNKEIKMNE